MTDTIDSILTGRPSDTFAQLDKPITRDRYGRPLIVPPDGDKPVPYTRVTTLAGTLDDMYGLMSWKQRQTAVGLGARPDLMLAVQAAAGNKGTLNRLCDEAMEAAGSSAAATFGTAMHSLSEQLDLGQPMPDLSPDIERSLSAYHKATRHLEIESVEQFLVCDEVRAAGTTDRIVTWPGLGRFILDLKTGKIEYGMGKIAMQLAIYARASAYDVATATRTPLDVDLNNALVVHLPKDEGVCRLWWVDIASGWEAVQHALWVREWRSRRNLSQPAGDRVTG